MVKVSDFEKEAKRRKRKEWLTDKATKVANFCRDNKEIIILVGAGVTTIATGIIKPAMRRSNLKKEENMKELYCYDRSLGHYWKLRHKLSNSEWLEVEQRKSNGEAMGDILRDMRVLY